MIKKSKPEKSTLQHRKLTIDGDIGSGIKARRYEQRGIRTLNFIELEEPQSAVLDASIDAETPIEEYFRLRDAANAWLRDAGEHDFFQVAEQAEVAKADTDSSVHCAIDDFAYSVWAFKIGERKGHLSPESVAARFLQASDFLHRRVSREVLDAIYAFATAWHWMHFENYGEHELAALGLSNAMHRSVGPQVIADRAAQKQKILEDSVRAFLSNPANVGYINSSKRVADKLIVEINDLLKSLDLPPFALSTLEKALRPLIKAKRHREDI